MATKNSDSQTIEQTLRQTVSEMAKDGGAGNQCGPKGAPKLTVPEHMRGLGITDTTPAARARAAEQDRNLHGAPPAPRKPLSD